MKVLFFMRSTVYVRNFESTLRRLGERGHDVHVVADVHELDHADLIGRLSREYPRITHSQPPARRATQWSKLGMELRGALDYLRYLQPEYRDAPKLRRRAELKAPPFVTSLLRRRWIDTRGGRWLTGRVVRWCDRAVPRDPAVEELVREHGPDLVLVTPLVEPGSPQSEFVRSAHALGIRTGLCVYSWDNLTNKGLIHDPLDLVTVWNQAMKDEAVTLHRVPVERVVITGAAAYDHWFGWKPRETRDAFCARVGLDASRPYILYLCSSKFIAPDELPFVRRWVQQVRAASGVLAGAGVLVRPHPQNTDLWRDADLGDLGNVTVWPRARGNPVDADSRAEYYDSIYHSIAVVGVNTSAQIESAIVGRGVYTVLAPEFRETQEGTLHFRHLRDVNGGLVHVAPDFAEHVAQLEAAVRNPDGAAERCRRFVEAFVRPYGIAEAATPRLVEILEATAARGARKPERGPWWAGLARPALAKAAAALDGTERRRDRRTMRAVGEEPAPEDARAKRVDNTAQRVKNGEKTPKEAWASAEAFEHYLRVRDSLRGLRQAGDELTASERRMLSPLEILWDAGPEQIADLRHYCKAITGVRRADYKGPKAPAVKARIERELQRLLEKGDRELWVEEPAAFGGFGFNGLGKRYNEDTLRFFRVVSLLHDAALLSEFRGAAPRRTVWEIGGGWGGFAYQFKTLCPNVTYLITATPDLLLLSAVYLMTLFPNARCRFYEPAEGDTFWRGWDDLDFVFAPESIVAGMRPPSLDLTVDLMMLERMSPPRIGLHVQRAYDLGSRYLFSMCPSATPKAETEADAVGNGDSEGNADSEGNTVSAVRPAVERLYWPHPVSAPLYLGKRLALGAGTRAGKRGSVEHTYLLGWRRLRV